MKLYAINGGQQDQVENVNDEPTLDTYVNIDSNEFIDHLLGHACPSVEADVDGFNRYYIETHCIGWWVTAKHEKSGEWTIKKMESVYV